MENKNPKMKIDWRATLLDFTISEEQKYPVTKLTGVGQIRMACNYLKKSKGYVFKTAISNDCLTVKRLS